MMAGFAHVPPGDLEALAFAVDEQTAAVLLCPIDFGNACRPLQAEYLVGVQDLCQQRGIMLLIDESRLCFASSGKPLAFTAAADITADAVILGGGLFAGLAGGVVLASDRLTGQTVIDTSRHPLLAAIVSTTLDQMKQHGLPESAVEASHRFAQALAEKVGGFEFVRDLHVSGMTIGIETDIVANEIVTAAGRRGLRLETAGETAVRMQLPLVIRDEEWELLLQRLGDSLEKIERSVVGATA
jgi:acetylornithine/succinyldiaminopimelate/putrescine aminotransferase